MFCPMCISLALNCGFSTLLPWLKNLKPFIPSLYPMSFFCLLTILRLFSVPPSQNQIPEKRKGISRDGRQKKGGERCVCMCVWQKHICTHMKWMLIGMLAKRTKSSFQRWYQLSPDAHNPSSLFQCCWTVTCTTIFCALLTFSWFLIYYCPTVLRMAT